MGIFDLFDEPFRLLRSDTWKVILVNENIYLDMISLLISLHGTIWLDPLPPTLSANEDFTCSAVRYR